VIDPLSFELTEESFNNGVITAAADSTHTASQPMILQELLVFFAGKLGAPVGVQDDRKLSLSLSDSHQNRLED